MLTHLDLYTACPISVARMIWLHLDRLSHCGQTDPLSDNLGGTEVPLGKSTGRIPAKMSVDDECKCSWTYMMDRTYFPRIIANSTSSGKSAGWTTSRLVKAKGSDGHGATPYLYMFSMHPRLSVACMCEVNSHSSPRRTLALTVPSLSLTSLRVSMLTRRLLLLRSIFRFLLIRPIVRVMGLLLTS